MSQHQTPWYHTILWALGIFVAGAILVGGAAGVFWGFKSIKVWSASIDGQAILAEAQYSRQARVEEARARNDAAELEGQAELTRAEFSARANEELADGLGGSEGYLRYLYIRMLEENGAQGDQIIYIPTEAGMPILEAGRVAQ
jgi:hypothetical protein